MSSQANYETRLFIDGEYVEATSASFFDNIDPTNRSVICRVQEASNADVNKAVEAAHRAFPVWSLETSARVRGSLLLKLADQLETHADEFSRLECLDVGKPIKMCKTVDIKEAVSVLRYYGGYADKIQGTYVQIAEHTGISCHTRREPVGVVAAILPWNYPLYLLCLKAAPALACGCTVVVKSSEKTPLSASAFGALIQKAGFPRGVLNIVCGFGVSVGVPLVSHPLVCKVSFTGSTRTGMAVSSECAKAVKRVTLELGGKSPLIVLEDADIKKAAKSAWNGLFVNSGQCCIACSRVFIQESVYDLFLSELVAYNSQTANLAHPSDECCTQGPIIDEVQYKKVLDYIEKGKQEGARVVTGGKAKASQGYWVEPTIFSDVSDEMTIAKEEIFGPVMCLFKFKTMEEALTRSNATEYGLGAGICTSSMAKAEFFVSRLRAGTVFVNTYIDGDVGVPFGGYKRSGFGREGGAAGLDSYLESKTVVTNICL